MPFKSKAQIAAEQGTGPAITLATGNETVATDKKEKKNSGVATDFKAQKELYKANQEIEDLKKALELAKLQANTPDKEGITTAPGNDEIAQLRAMVNQLSAQVVQGVQGKKLLFRTPEASDLQDETVVFTARAIFYIVGSYTDSNGLEKLPPFKLIKFDYVASDIIKEGKEDQIKSFSQYSTRLKPEIDFLRNHTYYGIAFSENTNEMMSEDTKETQFKLAAANQIATLAPEEVFNVARELNIPNYMSKSPYALKPLIIAEQAKLYKKQEKELQDEIIKRRALAAQVTTD
jgi:hypothetical protein